MTAPKVFIIILNWNNWSDTFECLESVKKINYVNFKVVVVDNGSTQKPVGFDDLIRQWQTAAVKFIFNPDNLGFSEGNNIGIKYALEQDADYILLLNNDMLVEPDFLSQLASVGQSHSEAGFLGPKILFSGAPKTIWFAGGKINWLYNKGIMVGHAEVDVGQYDQPEVQETDYITGACLLVKRQVVEKIGLMPTDYFLYYEDTDWSLRIRQAGFKCLFVPRAKVYHKGSRSSRVGSPSYIYYHSRNGLIMANNFAPWYIQFLVHLNVLWRIIKQVIKLIFLPSRRIWAKYILLGIIDFYLGRWGRIR